MFKCFPALPHLAQINGSLTGLCKPWRQVNGVINLFKSGLLAQGNTRNMKVSGTHTITCTVPARVKELIYLWEMRCVLTAKSFRIRNPVAAGIALATIRQGLFVKVCTEWLCQGRKIHFAAILDTLHPHGGLFVWSGITCHLYHHVSKNHRRLLLDLQAFGDTATV